jgi:protein-S-isoprenylcysteine O-methyltransferase Ste14
MNNFIAYVQLNRNIVILISPIFILIGIYSIFKAKKNYESHQRRSKTTSALCVLYHDGFVAIASYSAVFSTWPFFEETAFYEMNLFFFILGASIGFSSIILYILYLFKIELIARALGLNPDRLITDGIFHKSRNPGSLARTIGLFSLGLCGRSFYTLLLTLIWVILNHYYIIIEEKFLESTFGDIYMNYCSFTPRYVRIIKLLKK